MRGAPFYHRGSDVALASTRCGRRDSNTDWGLSKLLSAAVFGAVLGRSYDPRRLAVLVIPGRYVERMETMRAERAGRWDESPVAEYLRLEREVTMLQARMADRLARIDSERRYEGAGYLSAAAFVRDRAGVSAGEASRRVAEARELQKHPEVREAFATARVDRARVAMLLAAAKVSDEFFSRDEGVLVDTISGLSMKDSRRTVDYWKQAADQRAAAADAGHLHKRRRLHVSETLGGMVRIDGEFDPEGGQIVLTALRALTDSQQLDSDDVRAPAQRRADALTDICADYLEYADTPMMGAVRPHVSVIVSLEALRGGPGEPCELDDGTVITPETTRRIACDSSVSRIVVGGASEILDVGRATRSIPAAIRKALIIRDRHCRYRGCERPHRWCDAHHVEHWVNGGPTSLDNLVLLCRRHHRAVHEGGVRLPPLE